MPKTVTCIPAYNEERTIARVVLEAQRHSDLVIVCDDGSTDLTATIAEKMGAKVVRHQVNQGYGAALRTLFKEALRHSPDVVVTLDADLQHDPSYIPTLVEALQRQGADVVVASRAEGDETPTHRRATVKALSKLMGAGISDVQSGYRAYRASILERLIPAEKGMEASVEILEKALKERLKVVEVPVPFRYKQLDTSTLNPFVHGYTILARVLLAKVFNRPLTYLGIPGLAALTLGLSLGLWVIKRYQEVHQLATGSAIITAILLISGLLLLLMSIHLLALKEYIKLTRPT
ncbi:MAG: glycosyltransferase family 2 protein [Thermoprotei archaeon]|nr:MAG: glycosyltransferase family 2 protein [Thermoprotei archaeon]